MFRQNLENIFVVDGCDAAVGEVEAQNVDYSGCVVFYGKCLSGGLVFHANVLIDSSQLLSRSK